MTIWDVHVSDQPSGYRISGRVRSDKRPSLDGQLWFECEGGAVPPPREMAAATILASSLPTAVALDEDLAVEAPCDAEFLQRVPKLARAYARLHGLSARPRICGEPATSVPSENRIVASSFSGGADSLYTLFSHRDPSGLDPVGAIVTGYGIDIPHGDRNAQEAVGSRIARIADGCDVRFFTVRTNFRDVFDSHADWSVMTHGACVTSLAFALSGSVHTYLMPSSYPIDRLYAWGSHPLIDGSFVSSHVQVKNDAWEYHRNEKIAEMADWPIALEYMRVCNKGDRTRNCCRCEKCIRTMTLLMLLGKLDQASCFEDKLTVRQLARFKIKKPAELYWFQQMEAIASQSPANREIQDAIRFVLRVGRVRLARRELVRRVLRREARKRSQND